VCPEKRFQGVGHQAGSLAGADHHEATGAIARHTLAGHRPRIGAGL
jgi:hypothetical protein